MNTGLDIDVSGCGDEITLSGRLDARTAPIARAVLYAGVDDADGDLLVRVADLEIWDAVGMGVLVGAHAWARRRDRRLVLVDVAPRQLRLLRATRVARMLSVQPLAVA